MSYIDTIFFKVEKIQSLINVAKSIPSYFECWRLMHWTSLEQTLACQSIKWDGRFSDNSSHKCLLRGWPSSLFFIEAAFYGSTFDGAMDRQQTRRRLLLAFWPYFSSFTKIAGRRLHSKRTASVFKTKARWSLKKGKKIQSLPKYRWFQLASILMEVWW